MLAILDLPAVRHFTDDLNDRLRRCDNGEGMMCATLDESINFHVRICEDLRSCVNQWAQAIFTGLIAFDPEVESLLKMEARNLLDRAKQVAATGRMMNGQCYELKGLNALHYQIADFVYLLEKWVSPQQAVSPTPRIRMPDTAEQQIIENLRNLPPLPSDWRPTDPKQLAFFQKQRAE